MAAYSSESGIETDGDRYTEEKLYIKAIVPDKLAYDSKAPIVIVFNKHLPKSRTYVVDFTGTRRAPMQVTATQLNECTLLVQAPVYYPPEDVEVNVYYGVQRKPLGNWNFKFECRTDILAQLVFDSCDPVTFMCEALNISPKDLEHLDTAMSTVFMHNMPEGFDVLGAHRENVEQETYARYPTLLHFGATFGLRILVDSLLRSNCPGAPEAALLRNCDNMKPQELARYYGHTEIQEQLLTFEAANERDPYINMTSDDTYERMGREGEENYVSMEYNLEGDYYTDMTTGRRFANIDSNTDGDEYVSTDLDGRDQGEDEGGYLDVIGHADPEATYEVMKGASTDQVQGIYEDMDQELYELVESQDPAAPAVPARGSSAIYDRPSNLPVSDYPLQRSASNSMEMPRNAPQRLAVPRYKLKANSLPRGSSPQDTDDPSTDNVVVQSIMEKVQAGILTQEAADQVLTRLELRRSSTPTRMEPQFISRSGSTSSKISNASTASSNSQTSNISSFSSSSCDSNHESSGYGGDKEDNGDTTHMSLLKKIIDQQHRSQAKDSTEAPPTPPPADYGSQNRDPASLAVPPVSPRRQAKQQRPKTAPVNPEDVVEARVKGPPPALKRRGTAPTTIPRADTPVTEKPRALLPSDARRPSLPLQDQKRTEGRLSDKTKSRPPAALPGDHRRPAAPPPVKERNPTPPPPAEQRSPGVRGAVGSRPLSNIHGAVPTAFAMAMREAASAPQQKKPGLDEAPPPPPRPGQRAPLAPPRSHPRH